MTADKTHAAQFRPVRRNMLLTGPGCGTGFQVRPDEARGPGLRALEKLAGERNI